MGSPRIMGVSRPRISNPMRGMLNLFLGRASVLSSDVHVGLACSGMPDCFAKSGSWRTRADLEGCPTTDPQVRSLLHRQPRLLPRFPSAIERNGAGIAHLLQVVGGQRGAVSAAAVEHQPRVLVRHLSFNIALDDSLPQVYRAGRVPGRPFVILAHIHQHVRVARTCWWMCARITN